MCRIQVKSVKPCLKQLQQCIQTISTLHDDEILPTNPAALFHWLPKEHMCVLVYLVRRCYWHTACERLWKYSAKAHNVLCNIACLFLSEKVTVMHSMQAGYLEKAQKYTDKALMQLEKLKSKFDGVHSLIISYLMMVLINRLRFVCSKCWTAVPSCPRFKSSCWSISSCAGWSLDTRPQLYKKWVTSCRDFILTLSDEWLWIKA